MNNLEKHIFDGALKAQRDYEGMTTGWLSHGPESFLQIVVAQQIYRVGGYYVYVDASHKKTKADMKTARGRRPSSLGQRPDISIWNKSSNKLRAIIEIKRAYNVGHLKKDAKRVQDQLQKHGAKCGYILAYSEAKSGDTLQKRFRDWARQLSLKLVKVHVGNFDIATGDVWAIVLLRA